MNSRTRLATGGNLDADYHIETLLKKQQVSSD